MRHANGPGLRGLLLIAIALFLAACQSGREYRFEVTNKTGYEGMFLYVSPASSNDWWPDHLGEEFLPNGETWTVHVRGRNPMFDVQLVDVDGDSYTIWDVDVTGERLSITFDDLD